VRREFRQEALWEALHAEYERLLTARGVGEAEERPIARAAGSLA
jgi:hypothetical protein